MWIVSIFIVIEIYSEDVQFAESGRRSMSFNLYCNRNLFRDGVGTLFIVPRTVSIFIVIEIYSESAVCSRRAGSVSGFNLYCNRNLFRVLDMSHSPTSTLGFNLYCNRNLFRVHPVCGIIPRVCVSIFIVIEIYSETCTAIETRSRVCFNLYCNRNLFRVWMKQN